MKKIHVTLVLFLAFLLRIFIAPLYHHSDADTIFYWAKYLWETKNFLFFMGKAVPNAMPAIYPPIFYFILFVWRGFYEVVGQALWLINVAVPFFPSKIIFWFQQYNVAVAFNKIPAIFADIGCAYLIYRIILMAGGRDKIAFWAMILFLFLPPGWYNSAYWGQIDSIYSFFILLAFFLIFKERFLLSFFSLGVSLLIKPTGLFVLPIFAFLVIKQRKFIDAIMAFFSVSIFAFLLYFPFQPENTVAWSVDFYIRSFQGELNNMVSNAFNFWALIFGFEQVPDSLLFLGIPLKYFGYTLFSVSSILIIMAVANKIKNKKNFVISAFLLAFAAFLFLPRMHERYFYISLVLLAILAGTNKYWLTAFICMSIFHFFNLYHFWWYPKIPILISLLSNLFVIRVIIVVSLMFFGYSLFKLFHDGSYGNNC